MPKRTDIRRVLVIGSGPIVIGQACEFDYSGTQACKALRSEGLEVVLVNSNPATIMTDPEFADRTYVEPLTADLLRAIIERERPDALLPTVGGQTALNLAVEVAERGALDEFGVRLIGASVPAIKVAEDRLLFREAMREIDIEVPRSAVVRSLEMIAKLDDLRNHVVFQLAGAVTLQLAHGRFRFGFKDDESLHGSTEDFVRDSDDGSFLNPRMPLQNFFHLFGKDVIAARYDQLFHPPNKVEASEILRSLISQVPGLEPTVLEGFFRLLRHSPVSLKNVVSVDPNFSHPARVYLFSFFADNSNVHPRDGISHALRDSPARVQGIGSDHPGFGHSVTV